MIRLRDPLVVLAMLFVASWVDAWPQAKLKPTVILISIDGFRYDYLENTNCPTLRALAESGVKARWLVPIFPTKTFPNHYTLVTGLYAENHGVVGNTMYDPEFDALFSMGRRSEVIDGRWWAGEPIWVTAEKQGVKSATFFWPGSEALIATKRPSYWTRYDGTIPHSNRVRQVLNWLDYPEESRPRVITLYFEAVDHAGHDYGPVFSAMDPTIRIVDLAIGLLVEGLKARNIFESVNIIVVSDHGMAVTAGEQTIYLNDYVDTGNLRVVDRGIIVSLWSQPETIDSLARVLAGVHPKMRVYRKSEIPDRWRYKNNRRVAPLVLVAEEGWGIRLRGEREYWDGRERGGDHGYDNNLPSMRAFFVAHGPGFAQRKTGGPIENIHVYNLMCHLLGLIPAPNDGNLQDMSEMLR